MSTKPLNFPESTLKKQLRICKNSRDSNKADTLAIALHSVNKNEFWRRLNNAMQQKLRICGKYTILSC